MVGSYFTAFNLGYAPNDNELLLFEPNWMQVWLIDYSNLNIAAGNTVNGVLTVPSTEFIHCTNAFIRYTGTAPTNMKLQITNGTLITWLLPVLSPVNNEYYGGHVNWFFFPDAQLQIEVIGGTAGNDIYCHLMGMRYKLRSD